MVKRLFITLFVLAAFYCFCYAQHLPPQPDEKMDLFLLIIAGIGISAMLGGAIITAFFAALVLFTLAGLIGFGILSVSILAGIYTRSVSTIFKTFVVAGFTLCSGICGFVTAFIAKEVFHLSSSPFTFYAMGVGCGAVAGALLGFGTYHLFQTMLHRLIVRLKPA